MSHTSKQKRAPAAVGLLSIAAVTLYVACGGGPPPPGQPAPPAPPATDGPATAAAPAAEPTAAPPPASAPDAHATDASAADASATAASATAASATDASAAAPPAPATPAGPKDPFLAPTTSAGEDGWEVYQGMPTLTAANVKDVKPGTGSPEAAVAHFYASMIRGDKAYEQVLAPNPSARQHKRMKRKLTEVLTWKFKQVRLERRKKTDEGYWIKIFYEIEYRGKSDSGTDEAGVQQVGDQWFVASVPS